MSEVTVDALSEICASMRVESAMFMRLEASAPWGVRSPSRAGFKLVLVVSGSCELASRTSASPIVLRSGDVFIALDDTPFEMYDRPGSPILTCAETTAVQVGDLIRIGGGGAVSSFISGCFEIGDQRATPLMTLLPPLLLLRATEGANRVIKNILEILAHETARRDMGSHAAIARLFELLFIQAVRVHCEQHALPETGWLAASSDANLKHAIHAIHNNLGHDWTLESLAKIAGMSRSAFAARFKQKTGQTALDYLIRWRMHKAAHLLRHSGQSLHEIANRVGYQSDAAFNRVFKREIGVNPGEFRRTGRKQAEANDTADDFVM
jgi:AraC-like DNA-binding protein